jgi:predicted PurR-regulated permease PerM
VGSACWPRAADPPGLRILIVLLAALAFLIWLVMFAGSQIAAQAAQMPAVIETQTARVLAWGHAHGISVNQADFSNVAEKLISGVGPVTRALGGIFGGFGTAFLIMILGIYFVLEPDLYRRGIAWMLPEGSREHFHGTAHRMGKALRMLLFGRLIGMAVEGVATWACSRFMACRWRRCWGCSPACSPPAQHRRADLGHPHGAGRFSGGTDMGIFCIIVYVVVQTVDGNISCRWWRRRRPTSPRRWCWARS